MLGLITLNCRNKKKAACAGMSCEVDLILADEPTGNLDKQTAADIIHLFKQRALSQAK